MADAGPVFKRSKPRAGQRTREADLEPDEPNTENDSESPATIASKIKNKAKRAKAKPKLSFGGDEPEEGDTFQVKKSKLSRKLALGIHPANALPDTLDQATISARTNGGPVYNAAYLSELRASTQSAPLPVHDPDIYDANISMNVEDAVIMSSDVTIPSQSSIRAAKEKRERLRAIGPDEDYMSLAVTTRNDTYQGPHPESRLVREEDELGEGDDEYAEYTSAQERIALTKKSRKLEATKRKDSMQEMINEANEEDEESIEWEREQLRRGGLDSIAKADAAPVKQVYKPTPIPPSTDIPALGAAIQQLAQTLAALKASHVSNTGAATSLAVERDQLDARETELREMIAEAETKRAWFSEFKDWMESVATFLDEKFPELEKLEDEYVSILRGRADMLSQRRREDDRGDLSLIFGSPPSSRSLAVEEYDELGRVVLRADSVEFRKQGRAARIARRARRQYRRAVSETDDREEGYSTDSSLPSSDYQASMERIVSGGENILSDVQAVEFSDPSLGVGKWFGEWRSRYGDIYANAWGGLGLIGAWEFWVRLELLDWNPWESSQNLDEFSWYSSLHGYTQSHDRDEEPEPSPDGDLVSAMISTVVVPRICKMVESGALDPYSTPHIRRLIDIAEQVEASIGSDHHKYLMILRSVHTVFNDAVTAAETFLSPFTQFNHPHFEPEGIAARNRLLNRASKLLDMMLRWRKYTGEKLGAGELCVRFLRNYVLPIARSGWEIGGEDKARQMIATLPQELTGSLNF
ncbi:hypothetical protein ID866_4391 [Astraeus odoratus]|nr:hypothetical protein ID866_4391 [Astraeus odoratus]